ncbi:isoprenylcysteine carboxylmethyltransferase family protein [Ancylobacter sp. A5.8]|uniref:methyltransferase family protein n=1 Tax=Ancylobacter gelatini TaxID=2919920 RepID=UPI001F4E2B81|nr:isoprenylcysteine carboxylmethyltransferase family protein [Ancylobacter gelatini]
MSRSVWAPDSLAFSLLRALGQSFILTATLGRLWCTLYIGGRKNATLVTEGPYSVTRNPLYLFSIIGAAGAGLAFGSLVAALVLGGVSFLQLRHTAQREERLLAGRFGGAYAAYARRVPLLWPRLAAYREAEAPRFHPRVLARALRDALLFLLVLPVAEMIDYARATGLLPRLLPLL